MRQIKFRGKCIAAGKFQGKFVYGDLLQKNGKTFISPHVNRVEVWHLGKLIIMHEVDPETVGQYTGRTARNGVEIFEGDILHISEWKMNGYINYASCMFKVRDKQREEFNPSLASFLGELHCEVIGNIYEHPHLIE